MKDTSKILEAFTNGHVIREPMGFEKGYWIGCPGVFHDETDGSDYLTYRIRRPRGVQPDRGGEVRIARSTDGLNFDDVWTMTKDQVNSASIERSAVQRGADGQFRYFTSYVNEADGGRWSTTMLKGDNPAEFDVANMETLFKASDLGLEGVKDPWVAKYGDTYHMLLSVAVSTADTSDGSHETLDIFNTGECVSATALATSKDLDNWEWQGVVFQPEGDGWDKYCRRINSVFSHGDKHYAFYDGSASHAENYEERCGIAVSDDLRNWKTLTPDGPIFTSPHATGSLRYIDYLERDGKLRLYYELARADEAHDLRVIEIDPSELPFID